jgi:hypothetical protein
MAAVDQTQGDPLARDHNCLADYRDAVERLRGETIDELGGQPMPPEKASMLAVMVASLPMVAALHPAMPVQLGVWQVAVVHLTVWSAVFWLQRHRYNRFHARWHSKIAAHQEACVPLPAEVFRYRGRSGQTTGARAAENRLVSVSPSGSIASISSSRPARTTSARTERPSSSQTSMEARIQRQGARR